MDPMANPLSTGLGAAVIVPFVLETVKQWLPRWTPDAMNLVMRALQWAAAIATTAGIRYTFNAEAGTLLIEGLTMGTLLSVAGQVFAQYKSFEVVYRAAIKPPKGRD